MAPRMREVPASVVAVRRWSSSALERMMPSGLRISWAMLATTRPMLTSRSLLWSSFSSWRFFCMRSARMRSARWMSRWSTPKSRTDESRHMTTMMP